MRKLDRYVASYFVSSFALVSFFLIGFFLMVDALGKSDEFLSASQKLPPEMASSVPGYVFRYYVLSVPYYYLQFAPFIALLAVLFAGVRLSQSNELVPMVSAGVSLFRVMLPLFAGALLVTSSMIACREFLLPRIDEVRDSLRDRLMNQRVERIFGSFWTVGSKGENVRCGKFYPASATIEDFTWRPNKRTRLLAEKAQFRAGEKGVGWYLTGGTRQTTESGGRETILEADFLEGSLLSPEELLLAYKGEDRPEELSFSQINRLSLASPEKTKFITLLHYFLTFPLMALILPLLGLPFVLRFIPRSSSEGVIIALAIFASYFGIEMYLRNMGNQGVLHPLIASWLPVVLFGSLGIILFDSTRT